jgi:para-nitrobenzyl esterase
LVCSTYDTALRASKGAPVYMYNFDIPVAPALSPDTFLGATHGSELTYVFGTDPTQPAELQAARERMQRYWTNFARSGDPNGGDDEKWPQFSAQSDTRLNIGLTPTLANDFRAKQCHFWRSQYDKQFTATQ